MSAQNKASDQSAPPPLYSDLPLDDDQANNLELDQPRTTAANTHTTAWWERKQTKILLIGLAIVTVVVLCIVLPVTLTRRPQLGWIIHLDQSHHHYFWTIWSVGV